MNKNHCSNAVTWLDCTLRDGGYYTNWNFNNDLVESYISLCDVIGVDVVELGYLRLHPNQFGMYGNIPNHGSEKLAYHLNNHKKLRFAVMMDIKEFLNDDPGWVASEVDERIKHATLPISIIRVAVNYAMTESLYHYIGRMQTYGYQVCVNIMQIDLATEDQIKQCIKQVSKIEHLSALYIADSMGSMMPDRVKYLVEQLRQSLSCPIGFHAHDNIGLALHNSVLALDAGAEWIDSTFYGMGRGAGNAKTEHLIKIIRSDTGSDTQLKIFDFVARYMHELQDKYNWGTSPLYGMSAISQIHPTYVQALEENTSLTIKDKIDVLLNLRDGNAEKYSPEILNRIIAKYA